MDDGEAVPRFRVERATLSEVGLVAGVLEAASAWLRTRGIEQWPERFDPDWIGPPLERGETWLARVGDEVAATITLATRDPAWSDASDATYVHRLAVHRAFAGLGPGLLEWASAEARRRASTLLRLDCVSSNLRLRRYYADVGFIHRGDAIVHGTRVALLERPTGPGARRGDPQQPPELGR